MVFSGFICLKTPEADWQSAAGWQPALQIQQHAGAVADAGLRNMLKLCLGWSAAGWPSACSRDSFKW